MSTLYLRPAYPARQYGFTPAAEIVRDGEDAVVKLELPGVNVADDVTVEVDRGWSCAASAATSGPRSSPAAASARCGTARSGAPSGCRRA